MSERVYNPNSKTSNPNFKSDNVSRGRGKPVLPRPVTTVQEPLINQGSSANSSSSIDNKNSNSFDNNFDGNQSIAPKPQNNKKQNNNNNRNNNNNNNNSPVSRNKKIVISFKDGDKIDPNNPLLNNQNVIIKSQDQNIEIETEKTNQDSSSERKNTNRRNNKTTPKPTAKYIPKQVNGEENNSKKDIENTSNDAPPARQFNNSKNPKYNKNSNNSNNNNNNNKKGNQKKYTQPNSENLQKTNDNSNNATNKNSSGYSNKAPKDIKRGLKAKLSQFTHSEYTAKLTEELTKEIYDCMVCYDKINRNAAVWTCSSCFALFHIQCVEKWCMKKKFEQLMPGNNNNNLLTNWNCPACRAEVTEHPKPSCFCSKSTAPQYNPYLIPHSCGELCEKPRKFNCPHPCNLICHPGPCPPCPALGPQYPCYCGKDKFQSRCGEEFLGYSCDQPCNRLLSCNVHRCSQICHPGECVECTHTDMMPCYCGKNKKGIQCGKGLLDEFSNGSFTCDETCNRILSCGNHRCRERCHPGECTKCRTDISFTTCPCGSTKLTDLLPEGSSRKSCLDAIPTCQSICNRLLPCGSHRCPERCHVGRCKPCLVIISQSCRCGSTVQDVPCHLLYPDTFDDEGFSTTLPDPSNTAQRNLQVGGEGGGEGGGGGGKGGEKEKFEVMCQRKCDSLRACGRHRCNTTCCPFMNLGKEFHVCPIKCKKPLGCGIHKCQADCHKGRCNNCTEVTSYNAIVCRCGKTVVDPPVMCGTKIPACPGVCTREHSCDHEVTHDCHNNEDCPKCYQVVNRMCAGGHEKVFCQCHMLYPTCGKLCMKLLQCGLHTCPRICHPGACLPEAQHGQVGDGNCKPSCGYPCGAELLTCSHTCAAPCHPSKPCPDMVCQADVTLRCQCGNKSAAGKCMLDKSNQVSSDVAYRRLKCDESCIINSRLRQLAIAFGKSPSSSDAASHHSSSVPNISSLVHKAGSSSSSSSSSSTTVASSAKSSFNTFLVTLSPALPKILVQLENIFTSFISEQQMNNVDANEKTTYLTFPPMPNVYRRFIIELAKTFNLVYIGSSPSSSEKSYLDKENMHKNMLLARSPNFPSNYVVPKLLLSSVISSYPTPRLPGTTPGIIQDKLTGIILTDLLSTDTTKHFEKHLARMYGDYFIQWIDDTSAVILFNSEKVKNVAEVVLSCYYHVKPLVDDVGIIEFNSKSNSRQIVNLRSKNSNSPSSSSSSLIDQSAPSATSLTSEQKEGNTWECPKCTFLNNESTPVCEICQSLPPKIQSQPRLVTVPPPSSSTHSFASAVVGSNNKNSNVEEKESSLPAPTVSFAEVLQSKSTVKAKVEVSSTWDKTASCGSDDQNNNNNNDISNIIDQDSNAVNAENDVKPPENVVEDWNDLSLDDL